MLAVGDGVTTVQVGDRILAAASLRPTNAWVAQNKLLDEAAKRRLYSSHTADTLGKKKHRKTSRLAAKTSKFAVVARKRRKVSQSPKGTFAAALGLRTDDVVEILGSIESGLPFDTLRRFRERVDLPWNEVAELIQIKPRTLTRRKLQRRLQPDESDRVVRASRIFEKAAELFEGDLDAARRWLSSPQQALAGSTPFAFAKTDLGAREVENVIGRLEHGVFS